MYNKEAINKYKDAKLKWNKDTVEPVLKKLPERQEEFKTLSSKIPVNRLYGPDDVQDIDYMEKIGFPGQYPFTRGVQPTGYRGKLWTRRLVAGLPTPTETNKRLKYLIEQGQTGLNVVFDMPTHCGLDPDHELAMGEVGKEGVPLYSLEDMEDLMSDINLNDISMSIIDKGTVTTAFYFVLAEKRGIPVEKLRGTTQNDMLHYYHTSYHHDTPLMFNLRLLTDLVEYCSKNVPLWNPLSISGYNIRESGCSAAQEIAFCLGEAIAYTELFLERGMAVDEFAPRISFFLNAHNDFFEEIAKYRAIRRMWAKIMRERFGAKNPKSWLMRFHTQTAGSSLTAQLPYNNIVRTTVQALAAILGGTQSLHTNSFDEALSLPTEEAVQVALHTQLILTHENGVGNTVDPLAGSYFVESLTDKMEEESWNILDSIEKLGGMVEATLSGWVIQQKAEYNRNIYDEIDNGERLVIGLNCYKSDKKPEIKLFKHNPDAEKYQIERVKQLRQKRDNEKLSAAMRVLESDIKDNKNTMESTMEAVRCYATLGEIYDLYRKIVGNPKAPDVLFL